MDTSKKSDILVAPQTSNRPGNLLSTVAPPAELPNFVTSITKAENATNEPSEGKQTSCVDNLKKENQESTQNFYPAIPYSAGEPVTSLRSPEESLEVPDDSSKPQIEALGDIMPGSGLLTWVKGAVSSGGLLQRVAEKARSSVDTMITTLDPQMKEYLNSGGDMYLVVASNNEIEISPIREAFQSVFGKATIVGYESQSGVTAAQPVGCAAAYAGAKQRLAHVRSEHSHITNNMPILAVESFLHEAIADRWFEFDLLVLCHAALGIELVSQAQGVPVPAAAVSAAREGTPADYAHKHTGFGVTIASIMAANLQVDENEWQERSTGVSRRATLSLAARTLASSYQRLLALSEDKL